MKHGRLMGIMIINDCDHESKKYTDEENLKSGLVVRKPLEDIHYATTDEPGQDEEI
jgi:hypothetical protein